MDKRVFRRESYNYPVEEGLIAQQPFYPRDECRLLILDRATGNIREGIFKEAAGFLNKGDVLVLNDTKVIKARMHGRKNTGGKVEALLLKEKDRGVWEALLNPGRRIKTHDNITFGDGGISAEVIGKTVQGSRILRFFPPDFKKNLNHTGSVPTPPYIKQEVKEFSGYQTVYARNEGSVAAPTAGLHFTERLLGKIKTKGVDIVYLTVHCGLATFRPVKSADIRDHDMDSEWVEISETAAAAINRAKSGNKKIIAVGTTAVRALESFAVRSGSGFTVKECARETDFYIVPGYQFKIVDKIITNFHTPSSTNLILMTAFCGPGLIKKSYRLARNRKFRFFSFGDAMLAV